jgi:hypothetical protein
MFIETINSDTRYVKIMLIPPFNFQVQPSGTFNGQEV